MRNENERAEFEKVVREDHGHLNLLVRDDGKYVNLYTQSMFDLWCHARSRSSAVPAVTDAMVHAACAAHDAVGWKMASGETLVDMQHWMRKALNAALAAAPEPQQAARATEDTSDELHPRTRDLANRFSAAMAEKLLAAQRKYGYSDGWADPSWMDECRAKLLEHVAKGDPRDVANYCAFLWSHGESTAAPSPHHGGEPVAWMAVGFDTLHRATFSRQDFAEQHCVALGQAGIPGMHVIPLYAAPVSAPAQASQITQGAVAELHISERGIDLCPIKSIHRQLRGILGDGVHSLFAVPQASRVAIPPELKQPPLYADEGREDQYGATKYAAGWNDCRAKMLSAPADARDANSDAELIEALHINLKAAREFADRNSRDARRYRIVRRGQHWSIVDGSGEALRADALDVAVDVYVDRAFGVNGTPECGSEQDERDREVGRKWRTNSALEEWFPLTADQLARAEADSKRIDYIAREYLELTPFNMPTGADDADVGWRIYEFHQGAPHKRLVAEEFRDDLRAAIDSAMGAEGGLS